MDKITVSIELGSNSGSFIERIDGAPASYLLETAITAVYSGFALETGESTAFVTFKYNDGDLEALSTTGFKTFAVYRATPPSEFSEQVAEFIVEAINTHTKNYMKNQIKAQIDEMLEDEELYPEARSALERLSSLNHLFADFPG